VSEGAPWVQAIDDYERRDIRVDGQPISDHAVFRSSGLHNATLLHTGYLDEVNRSKGKVAQNLRIATAEVATADPERRGVALVNLARSNLSAGRPEAALSCCLEALKRA
jgi:hypothetical protein